MNRRQSLTTAAAGLERVLLRGRPADGSRTYRWAVRMADFDQIKYGFRR